ncbi:CidA/LrgA family protein [Vibrio gallicus]|uniref:CidA/LrgA family protein n=1 Tax=Vibrio gallicus TaxID=190897 RepID=UPI0021C48BF1|nr:CidA/LrgA family protein [Vibrio gallicus]
MIHAAKQHFITFSQVTLLCLFWMGSNLLVNQLHIPLPANVFGMFALLLLLSCNLVKVNWFKAGSTWLIAEMLLFFIPAVIAIVNYQDLFLSQGLKIMAVIGISTILVLAVTALVVDKLYHYELRKMEDKQ